MSGPAATFVVVDDHAGMRAALRFALQRAGYSCVGDASDGRSAVELLLVKRPDFAVVDIRMPGMDGIDVVRELRRRGATTGIVVHSAFIAPAVVQAVYAAGAQACVAKDASPRTLVEAAERAIASRLPDPEDMPDASPGPMPARQAGGA